MIQPVGYRGFTLIELLVVITIIVVLLSLLTPSLDRAIYQAELAVCAAQQKAATSGFTTYAMNHRRRYAPRSTAWTTIVIANGTLGDEADDRDYWRPYLSIDSLLCPLAGDISLDEDTAGSTDAFVDACMNIFAGWNYSNDYGVPSAGMNRIGDRWSFTFDYDGNGAAETRRFNWLLNSAAVTVLEDGHVDNYTAHPDADGIFTQVQYDYEEWEHAPFFVGNAIRVAWAGWWSIGSSYQRGTIEMNAGAADGSVVRHDQVGWDWQADSDRILPVPYDYAVEDWPTNYVVLPRR